MRQLLVTGATGCIGRAVTRRALSAGWKVRGLARRAPQEPVFGMELVLGSVEDEETVARAVDGCSAVVHLAAYVHQVPTTNSDRMALRRSIVGGTRNVARHARATNARLVNASTVAVYGSTPAGPSNEQTPTHAETAYAQAKLEAEAVVMAVDDTATSLRIALVYGPHDRGNLLVLLRTIERGVAFVVGDGSNRKSVVFVENLADRFVLVLERSDLPGIWIAADRPAPTQRELVNSLAAALNRRPPIHVPRVPLEYAGAVLDLARRAAGHPPRWRDRVRKLACSTEFHGDALDATLGYDSAVSLDEGLRRTVIWYRAKGHA